MWSRVLAAFVLVGLLAMTWFGVQRMAHAESAGTAHHTATSAHHASGHDHGAAAHAQNLDDHDDHDHSHVVELLLGFFMALLAAALLALWSQVPRRPMVIFRRARTRLLVHSRQPDPPCLTRLSILRC